MVDYPIRTLTPSEFPPLLHEIPDPPKSLYVRGTLAPKDHQMLVVVGSREHSVYGRQAAETLIKGLHGYPVSIISGLAIGIDGVAHQAALDAGLHTIAVLGSGITDDAVYPRRNLQLARRILDAGGALLGEFADPIPVTRWAFPQRNRIKAGMAHATLIIEAGEKSGTLITARFAMEYNRDVLAVPGPIFSSGSFGPNMLIKDGAIPVAKIGDLIEALGLVPIEKLVQRSGFSGTEPERRLLACLSEPMEKDALISISGMHAHEANITLSLLELRGAIREDHGVITRLVSM